MKMFNSIAKHNTKFQGKNRIRRKVVLNKNLKIRFASFLAKDIQIALQIATQNFKFKVEFLEYRFERVKLCGVAFLSERRLICD